jgi:hypothetical protein
LATDASSFKTCTRITPPAASSASAIGAIVSLAERIDQHVRVEERLSLIRLLATESEAVGQWPAQLAQPLERSFTLSIAAHLELTGASDSNLDLIALFEIERLDDRAKCSACLD